MRARMWPMLLGVLALVGCGGPPPTPIVIQRYVIVTATPTPLPSATPTPVIPPTPPVWTYQDMTVAFLQTGPGSGWRAANTASFKETAEKLDINLLFYDSQNNFEQQIAAFRDFIADARVHVVVLAAVESTGYDEVLREARDAGKVVILEDLRIDASEDLYATYVGSDFVEEGRKAGWAMIELLEGSEKKNVVELVGYRQSHAAQDRGQGFREATRDSGIAIIHSQVANWSIEEGKQVMEIWLKEKTDIQGVFAQNDEMGLGAIEAIKEAGLRPGVDIKIVIIDATSGAFEAMLAGELNVSVECSSDVAPQVYAAALKALNGEALPKWIPAQEGVFYADMPDLEEIAEERKY